MTDTEIVAVVNEAFYVVALFGGVLIMLNAAILMTLLGGRRG